MSKQQLDIIDFKNRPWLFLVLIPIAFGLFFLNFAIYFFLSPGKSTIGFYSAFVFFFLEMQVVRVIFSKYRYIPNGQLNFNKHGVFIDNSSQPLKYGWEKVTDLKFYYRGDRFWKFNLGKLTFNRGKRRYRNLHWFGKKGLDERIIDRIDINGKSIYVKIRNEAEKNTFFEFISISKKMSQNVNIIETDFTTKLFGKTIEI